MSYQRGLQENTKVEQKKSDGECGETRAKYTTEGMTVVLLLSGNLWYKCVMTHTKENANQGYGNYLDLIVIWYGCLRLPSPSHGCRHNTTTTPHDFIHSFILSVKARCRRAGMPNTLPHFLQRCFCVEGRACTDDEWEQLLIRWGNTAVGWFVMTDPMSGWLERFDKIGDQMPSMDASHIIFFFEASKPSAHCEIGSNFVFSSCVKTCIYLCVFHQGLGCKAAWTPPHHFPPKTPSCIFPHSTSWQPQLRD